MRFADLGAVTVDGFGTLVELESPVEPLVQALSRPRRRRSPAEVARAFAAEAAHYRLTLATARDAETLAGLRRECVAVFLATLAAPVEPEEFVDAFLAALVFRPAPGRRRGARGMRSRGLKLAVVSNWDCSLPERLEKLDLLGQFDAVVTSAEAGVPEAGPGARSGSRWSDSGPRRDPSDPRRRRGLGRAGAAAAGMRFAPAPLSAAVEALS